MIKLKNILTEKKELSKSIVDDIAKMTDRNDHNGARMELAKAEHQQVLAKSISDNGGTVIEDETLDAVNKSFGNIQWCSTIIAKHVQGLKDKVQELPPEKLSDLKERLNAGEDIETILREELLPSTTFQNYHHQKRYHDLKMSHLYQ